MNPYCALADAEVSSSMAKQMPGVYEEHDADTNNTSDIACMDSLELGFVEKPTRSLLSHMFPSKVGGFPAWLALDKLPGSPQLACKLCNQPMKFLLQVYAPIDGRDDCFHRTIFIFICRNGACYKQDAAGKEQPTPVIALRCQLARENAFYPMQPPNYDAAEAEIRQQLTKGQLPHAAARAKLCEVCGLPGSKLCGSCRAVSYCSKEHQLLAWRGAQGHKTRCAACKDASDVERLMAAVFPAKTYEEAVLPEWDLVLGPAVDEEEIDEDAGDTANELQLGKTGQAQGRSTPVLDEAAAGVVTTGDELDIKELELAANQETPAQQLMRRFKWQIMRAPQQVVRYQWPSLEPLRVACGQAAAEANNVPACERCGAARRCEVQVLPQLLSHLGMDHVTDLSPDWGTLLVFTCSASCCAKDDGAAANEEYHVEHVLLQHFD